MKGPVCFAGASAYLCGIMNFGDLGLLGLFLGNVLAATIVPFSSDALYIAAIAASGDVMQCFIVASLGNWLGSLITYGTGYIGRWEWIEKWFKVKRETLEKQKKYVSKYGVWLALIAWVPVIGDVLVLALGFYKTRPICTSVLLLIGKALRFAVWTALYLQIF